MKKMLLCLVILLTGCLGSGPTPSITISGAVYQQDTAVPVVNAKITIETGSRSYHSESGLDGSFAITLRSSHTLLRITVEHPGYKPLTDKIHVNPSELEFLVLELTPKTPGQTLVAGRIDYALPKLSSTAGVYAASAFPAETNFKAASADLTEIIVEPYIFSEATAAAIASALQAKSYRLYHNAELLVLEKPWDTAIEIFVEAARNHPLVRQADINFSIVASAKAALAPMSSTFDNHSQWNFQAIYMNYAWQQIHNRNSDRRIRIAVLDTLIDIEHPDLNQILNLDDAYNVVKQNQHVGDNRSRAFSHGTHVAGIIAAAVDFHHSIEIIPIVVFDENDRGKISDLIAGIEKALELDVDIINISLGIDSLTNPYSHSLYKTIQKAADRGILMTASAGNYGNLIFPAKYSEVMAVGASTIHYQIADYSAASGVEVFAPGGELYGHKIYSTNLRGAYAYAYGTSMAAPHAAGAAALIKLGTPNITNYEIEQLLWETGTVLNFANPDQRLINAYAAITRTPIANAVISFREKESLVEYKAYPEHNRYFYQFLPPGSYLVSAHIDTDRNQFVNSGDWYYQQEITVEADQHINSLEIRLEVYP